MAEQLKSSRPALTRPRAPTNIVGAHLRGASEQRPTDHPIQAILLLIIYVALFVAFAILCG